ncbi:MAG: diaminopimelate epimerase [Flavobacteriaceae bacterium]|jgi:diaminopimelate epimerase|nr:diaminopimelate epimerase [Flavobacteriaceae bacterium]MBT6127972.1 diaminopimelate epimerase [Flavobacteriaceae bacterium]MDG1028763.1 diaminopimelate epimerase [Flavobacteriaceae bacterium]
MDFQFEKYQGAGNDFIIIDDRKENFPDQDHSLIQKHCDRHFGIGADGLILVRDSDRSDFKMLYFNADGHPSSLCGNGSRCVFAFANKHQMIGNEGTFETSDGIHRGSLTPDDLICIEMGDVLTIEKRGSAIFMDTGSPHHIEFVDQVSAIDVKTQGAAIRYGAPYFETGSNANFVEKVNEKEFNIRTYERGVEDETLACGTGAVAAAIGAHFSGQTPLDMVNINALGGCLQVSFTPDSGQYKNILLIGPATYVFSGNLTTE